MTQQNDPADAYILHADEIAATEGRKKAHFLIPNARRANKNLGDRVGLTGFGFHRIEVEPGCETTEHHVHYHEDECVFVLDGTAVAVIGEEEHAIGPGDDLDSVRPPMKGRVVHHQHGPRRQFRDQVT
ncbi:MAG: hypothetical protein CR993_09830, partial [Rhodobacterales bacterium]